MEMSLGKNLPHNCLYWCRRRGSCSSLMEADWSNCETYVVLLKSPSPPFPLLQMSEWCPERRVALLS